MEHNETELSCVCVECGANMRLHLTVCPCCGYSDTVFTKESLEAFNGTWYPPEDETQAEPNLDALL